MTDSRKRSWWQERGTGALFGFWGVLVGLSLFVLATPQKSEEVMQGEAVAHYHFTFDQMRMRDQTEDLITLVNAREAEYDPHEAQVLLTAPVIIVQSTREEELWRATAQSGRANVPDVSELFPSSLGNIRLATDVSITDESAGRVLNTSAVVSYLAEHRLLVSKDRTLVIQTGRGEASFPYGFLMKTLHKGQVVWPGRPGVDLVEQYLARQGAAAKKPGKRSKK